MPPAPDDATPRFTRQVEDFTCGHCVQPVRGNGYTNHCPACLWSRHVDINPGDRAADCGGLMEPIAVTSTRRGYVITHRCVACGFQRDNKAAAEDNFEVLLRIASERK
jgi:hypothetical protein